MGLSAPVPPEIGGYVLAGGRSSRMGRDKALIELAGKPLIRHAVKKLRRICMDVRILSANPELEAYAPLVPDLHPGCGPLGGFEAGIAHSIFDWNLFMPVDMPFLPSAFLNHWVRRTLQSEKRGVRMAMFTVDDLPQGALALLHREALPFLVEAIEGRRLKVYAVLEAAGRELAGKQGVLPGKVFRNERWGVEGRFWSKEGRFGPRGEAWQFTTEAQQAAKHLWFANLNTPEDLAEAEAHSDALDT
jgi:molybdopterin-guanine dinucleotide biosynthesis protein A